MHSLTSTKVKPAGKHSFVCLTLVAVTLLLAACGFKMRGTTELPFQTFYTNISSQSAFGSRLIRNLNAISPHTNLVTSADQAQVRFEQISLQRSNKEMSLDTDGRIEEYELTLSFTYRLIDQDNNLIVPDTTLRSSRLMPYSENEAFAGSAQMNFLYADMEKQLVNTVIRQITSDQVISTYKSFHP